MFKRVIKIAGKIITLFSLLFIVLAVTQLDINISAITNIPLFIAVFILCSFGIMGAEFLLGYAWKHVLDTFSGKNNSLMSAEKVYLKANIGKYLPGNVMHYVERNLFAVSLGVQQKEVLLSTIIEILGIVLVAGLFSILFAYDILKEAIMAILAELPLSTFALLGAGFFLLLLLIGYIFRRALFQLYRTYFNQNAIKALFFAVPFYALFLLIGSLTFVLILYCIEPSTSIGTNLNLLFVSYILAWVIGFAVPGAPGGVGVREFVLLYLLSEPIGADLVLTAILLHRLVTIAGDFEAYFATLFFKKIS